MSNEDVPCYIARCLCGCGALIFATVDKPEHKKSNAKEIAKMIRLGYTIERETVRYVRQSCFGCLKKEKDAGTKKGRKVEG